jgi:hypothetical protein
MPPQDVLIMAMTHMRIGICTAGFSTEPDPVTHLKWIRPVKQFGALLPGDMTDTGGRLAQMDDVVRLHLQRHAPEPPHVEDWETDFIVQRPVVVRRLEGDKRADFLAAHLDPQPIDVLHNQTRSLCLIRPDTLWAMFSLDAVTQKFEARIGFSLSGVSHPLSNPAHGMSVTDLRWRALGRQWLAKDKLLLLELSHQALLQRLNADAIYLSIGLTRKFKGTFWPMVIGLHATPDYEVIVDMNNP